MIESFVDLTYRGLSLGRHIKLSQVRPRSAYLELAAPMPVGTALALSTPDGLVVQAVVTAIREQIAGTEEPPGMTVTPALADPQTASWWQSRVELAEDLSVSRVRTRPRSVSLAPAPTSDSGGIVTGAQTGTTTKTATVPPPVAGAPMPSAIPAVPTTLAGVATAPMPMAVQAPIIAAARAAVPAAPVLPAAPVVSAAPVATAAQAKAVSAFAEAASAVMAPILPGQGGVMRVSGEIRIPTSDGIIDDGKKTVVMDSIDPALIEQLTRADQPVVDDGKRTQVMEALNPDLIDGDAGASGSMPASGDDKNGPRGKRRKKGR